MTTPDGFAMPLCSQAFRRAQMRILEISRVGLLKSLLPDSTKWIRWGGSLTADEPIQPEQCSVQALGQVLRQIAGRQFDLLVLPALHPDHHHDQSLLKIGTKVMAKGAVGMPFVSRILGQLPIKKTRYIIIDINDTTQICDRTTKIFPHYEVYFKRELDFSLRDANYPQLRTKPISLFLPDERPKIETISKDIDVFFAGTICNDVRRKAVDELQSLHDSGFSIYFPKEKLSYQEYIKNLSRSWIVLSPEGHGWDCYRHYESGFAGSVPLINYPSYRREIFLKEGVHCIYYDSRKESVADKVRVLLQNKADLLRIGAEARRHILRYHTRAGVARSILEQLVVGI
jgi:hypothetical protein